MLRFSPMGPTEQGGGLGLTGFSEGGVFSTLTGKALGKWRQDGHPMTPRRLVW